MTDQTNNPSNENPTPASISGYTGDEPSTEAAKPKVEEPQVDEFGYKIAPEKKEEQVPPAPQAKEEEGEKDPSIPGYTDDKEEEGKEGKKEGEEEKKPEPEAGDIDLGDTEGFLEDEVKELKKLAKESKLSPEQVKAVMDFKRSEIKKLNEVLAKKEETMKAQKSEVLKKWKEDLKTDPNFGGENFNKSLKMVGRVLQDFLPESNKKIAESGGAWHPTLMKEFRNLAEVLYSNKDNLVRGEFSGKKSDPSAEKSDDDIIREAYS
jgi:hypothetical protein